MWRWFRRKLEQLHNWLALHHAYGLGHAIRCGCCFRLDWGGFLQQDGTWLCLPCAHKRRQEGNAHAQTLHRGPASQ